MYQGFLTGKLTENMALLLTARWLLRAFELPMPDMAALMLGTHRLIVNSNCETALTDTVYINLNCA